MSVVLEKDISFEKKKSNYEFEPSFFEKFLLRKNSVISDSARWKSMCNTAIVLYLVILFVYYGCTQIFSSSLYSAVSVYNHAAPIVISIVFWPFIVIYDCELFYRLYGELRPLLKNTKESDVWYYQIARCNFGFLCSKEIKALISVFVNCIVSVVIALIFYLNISGSPLKTYDSKYVVLLAPLVVSIIITYISSENKNINMILTVVNGGLTYYTYILQYAKEPIPYLFNSDCYVLNILLLIAVAVVFFIAGATIMPMVGMFRAFYLSKFEEKLSYPIENIASSLNRINKIKRYFLHLTGITLLAYFQLLGSVYFLGILNRKSLITIFLFTLGSLFPLIMYLAANVFFKKLSHKIYCLQVEKIDKMIDNELGIDQIDSEKLQALIEVKQMYSDEFEIHVEINKEIFFTMLSPLATTVVALIFPFAG